MNKITETYKFNFFVFCLIFCFSVMHFFFNGVYSDTSLERLIDFDVRKPYIYRLLIPVLVKIFSPLINFNIAFFFIEIGSCYLFYASTKYLFRQYLDIKKSSFCAALAFLLTHLIYLINYRQGIGACSGFFYPYDMPALVFLTLGLSFILQKNWRYLYVLLVIATLNRETSLLIVLAVPAIYMGGSVSWKRPFLFLLSLYSLIRIFLYFLFKHYDGNTMELHAFDSGGLRLRENIDFLFNRHYWLWILSEMAYLPVLWLAVNHYIPRLLVRLRFVALFYVLVLFVVGSIPEARIWGEAMVILYFPTALGVISFLNEKPQLNSSHLRFQKKVEHHLVPIVLFFFFVSSFIIVKYI